jgi:xanthine/uracil permease
MKKYKTLFDILLVILLGFLTVATIMPEVLSFMPNAVQMALFVIAFGLVALFLVFIWREKPQDEREAQNQQVASRAAYVVGCLVLIIALVYEAFTHTLDSFVPVALLAMIITKIIVQNIKNRA